MTDQELFDKQEAVKKQFDDLTAQKNEKDIEIENLAIEMNRLQGEYRLLDKLRKELRMAETKAIGTDPASTLPADPLNRPKKEIKNGRK